MVVDVTLLPSLLIVQDAIPQIFATKAVNMKCLFPIIIINANAKTAIINGKLNNNQIISIIATLLKQFDSIMNNSLQ